VWTGRVWLAEATDWTDDERRGFCQGMYAVGNDLLTIQKQHVPSKPIRRVVRVPRPRHSDERPRIWAVYYLQSPALVVPVTPAPLEADGRRWVPAGGVLLQRVEGGPDRRRRTLEGARRRCEPNAGERERGRSARSVVW
jgi:hypothetical protein